MAPIFPKDVVAGTLLNKTCGNMDLILFMSSILNSPSKDAIQFLFLLFINTVPGDGDFTE